MGKRAYHSRMFPGRFQGSSHVVAIDEWLNTLPGEIVGVAIDVCVTAGPWTRRYLDVHVVTEEKGSVSIGSEP